MPTWVFWAELGLVLATSTAFFLLGLLLSRRHVGARYACIVVGAVGLGYRILTTTFPDRFYVEWPYLLLSGVIAPAGFLLVGAAFTLPMRKSRQRILIGVFSVVLVYYVFCDAAYLAVAGGDLARLEGRWETADLCGSTVSAMAQSRPFTCGPAAAASLLHTWELTVREGELAYAARTTYRGTEPPRLAAALRLLGRHRCLRVRILDTTFGQLRQYDRPAILLVTVRSQGRRHVVTLLKMVGRRLVIADPAPGRGALELSRDEFAGRYHWDGRALLVWRDPDVPRLYREPPQPTLRPTLADVR
ncbi:MAG: cysteine peptidase family C39 domain-containing protein [Planctomycetota bacterium]